MHCQRFIIRHCNFNPRSPCGERLYNSCCFYLKYLYFNPRSPCGERPIHCAPFAIVCIFQPTLPVRGATPKPFRNPMLNQISTHAPRAGSDTQECLNMNGYGNFNPRSPCGERLAYNIDCMEYMNFNPRSPCGERRILEERGYKVANFNPRSPCGERRLRAGSV